MKHVKFPMMLVAASVGLAARQTAPKNQIRMCIALIGFALALTGWSTGSAAWHKGTYHSEPEPWEGQSEPGSTEEADAAPEPAEAAPEKAENSALGCGATDMSGNGDGPGGVGDVTATSSLVLWLDANQITGLSNNAEVTTWCDASAYGNDAEAKGEPNYQTDQGADQFNSMPLVVFKASDYDEMIVADADSLDITTAMTLMIAADYKSSSYFWTGFFSKANNDRWDAGYGFGRDSNSEKWFAWVDNFKVHSVRATLSYDDDHIITMMYDQVKLESWYEETSQGTHSHGGALSVNGHGVNIGKPEAGTYNLNGRIAEIVPFKEALNDAQRIIVSNYMGAKYNIALDANDFYDEDDTGNGDYDFDVACIGQAADGSNHTDARGTGLWRMSGATDLGNGEYLIWGRDNGSEGATTTGVPATVEEMLARGWRMSETGDVGDVTISVHLTSSATASDLRLIIDDDNDGDFSDETAESGMIGGATSIGDNEYQFASVTKVGDNKRFTLGTINKAQTPLSN